MKIPLTIIITKMLLKLSLKFWKWMRTTNMVSPWRSQCWLVVLRNIQHQHWRKFNFLLKTVDLDDRIGHLFIVDIEFDKANATEWEYMYKEIMAPIIEKQKILEANEQPVY